MAKTKKNARSNRRQRSAAGVREAKRQASLDPVASLLLDPCNSDASVPFYNGDGGYSQRLTGTYTVTTGATDTALSFALYPGAIMSSQGTAATSATTLTNQFTTNGIIGGSFIGGNMNKIRCKAACVEMWSSQAPLNITGNVAFGVISAGQYQSGLATTVDGLTQLVTHQTKLTSDIVECLWYPGANDCFYYQIPNTLPSTVMPADSDDRNCIAFAASGLPSSTAYTFRVTMVLEWSPKPALGLPVSHSSGGDAQHTYNVVTQLHHKKPGWYARMKSHAHTFAEQAAPIIKSQLATGITNYGPQVLKAITGMLV